MSSNRSNDRGNSGRVRGYPVWGYSYSDAESPFWWSVRQEEERSGSARAAIGVITIPAAGRLVLAGVVRQAN